MTRLLSLALVALVACDSRTEGPPGGGGGGGGGGGISVDGGGAGGGTTISVDGGGGGELGCVARTDQEPVQTPATEPPPLMGGSMAVLADGSFVIADVDRAQVWLVSANLQTTRTIPLLAGDEPGRVIEGAPGHVFVALRRTSQLAELDVATATLTRRIDTCALPRGLAWRPADARLVVACLDGALETIDVATATRAPVTVSAQLDDLRDVVVDGDDLLVTTFRSGLMFSIAADGAVTSVTTAPQGGFEPRVAWRAVPRQGGGATFVRQQHRTAAFSTSGCSSYGGFARDARTSGGGTGTTGPVVNSEVVTVVNGTASPTPLSRSAAPVVLPIDVAVSAAGRIAVVSAGTGAVTILEPALRRDVPVANGVTSVAFRGESAFVFVREPASLFEVAPDLYAVQVASLGGVSVASTGHELFHRATPASLTCASCHPEAGEDGHVWPFFEGARRTPTLRGGVADTKPFHWSGDLATTMDLMSQVMVNRMNGPLVSLERAQAVEDWLHAQAATPSPAVDSAAAARGKALFDSERTACASCHAGAQGTNNQTTDVGTGAGFQVPRLVEFARRAPWFHDGRMVTLDARFDPLVAGASHGQVADLTLAERADLNAYLRSR